MKNLKILVLMLILLGQQLTVQSFQRRAGSTVSRGLFTKRSGTGLGSSLSTRRTNVRSSTPITCSNPVRSRSRSIFSKARASEQVKQGPSFLSRHSGKLWVAGTAGALYAGRKPFLEFKEKHEKIFLDLREFKDIIDSKDKWNDSKLLLGSIERLQEDGGINSRLLFLSPLVLVMTSELKNNDKIRIMDLLIAHGAKPAEDELNIALEIFSIDKPEQKAYVSSDIKSNSLFLKKLLPYFDNKTLLDFIGIADIKINQIKKSLENKTLKTDNQKKLKNELAVFTELRNSAKNKIYKAKLPLFEKEEAELRLN